MRLIFRRQPNNRLLSVVFEDADKTEFSDSDKARIFWVASAYGWLLNAPGDYSPTDLKQKIEEVYDLHNCYNAFAVEILSKV